MEKEGKEMQHVIRMKGGLDEESYANNSKSQSAYLSKTVPVLVVAVLDLCETNLPEQLNIADLGCSSGPNTLFPISEITSIVYRRCCEVGRPAPYFCVFLNDLPGNDFNTVFRSLSAFQEKMTADNGPGFGPVYFYVFLVLFMAGISHQTACILCIQVPPELIDKTCPLINKGKIFILKTSSPAVIKAYASQFLRDFSSFLKARSKEVVPGGRMALMFRGRRLEDASPDESCLLWDYLGQAFQDLVSEGLIEEEKLDTYNTPYYEPQTGEIKGEVEKEGSFTVDSLVPIINPWDGCNGGLKCDRTTTARNMGKAIRAVNESMICSHFGAEIMDRLFDKFSEIMAIDTKEVEHVSLAVSLIRKSQLRLGYL